MGPPTGERTCSGRLTFRAVGCLTRPDRTIGAVQAMFQSVACGRFRSTLRASSSAIRAAPRAAARSAHHHPRYRLASKPTSASKPRDAPIPLRVPSPISALLDNADPPCASRRPGEQGRERLYLPKFIADCELSGAVPATSAWSDATVSTVAVRSRAATTTTDALASARSAAWGSERSRRNRQTRQVDPATSATTSSPRPRIPRLPANSPAVIDQVPTPRPQTTENMERRGALPSRAWRLLNWAP
jgi:hypothetical protein